MPDKIVHPQLARLHHTSPFNRKKSSGSRNHHRIFLGGRAGGLGSHRCIVWAHSPVGASSLPLLFPRRRHRRRHRRLLHDVSLRPLRKPKHPISRLAHSHRCSPKKQSHLAVVRFCRPHSHLGVPDEPSSVCPTSIHLYARLGASVTLPNPTQMRPLQKMLSLVGSPNHYGGLAIPDQTMQPPTVRSASVGSRCLGPHRR